MTPPSNHSGTKTLKIAAASNDRGAWINIASDEYFESREEAEQVASQFLKSHKVRVSTLGYRDGDDWSAKCFILHFPTISLTPDLVNGGFNETGVKRYRSTVAKAETLGYEITVTTPCANSITEETLEEMIS